MRQRAFEVSVPSTFCSLGIWQMVCVLIIDRGGEDWMDTCGSVYARKRMILTSACCHF